MNSKDKKKKKQYKILFMVTLAGLFGLLVIVYFLDTRLKTYEKDGSISISKYEASESENEQFKELISIDDLWLMDKQPNMALERLKELDFSDSNLNDRVEERIKQIESELGSKTETELTKDKLRAELDKSIQVQDSLYNQMDSLQQRLKTISNRSESKTDSLTDRLEKVTRQLNRKETLKVISFKSDKDVLVHYIGETQDDAANGSGIGVWANGSIYRGEWTNNKPDGRGEYKWSDGARYVGDFDMGERSGEGTFYYKTGERYEGEFENGLRSGDGTLYDIDGNESYTGKWKNDKPLK